MPAELKLTIRIKKNDDGSSALACIRRDGSVTFQKRRASQGSFFVLHDLEHLAVESVLGLRRGFYGLIAEGWGTEDFGPPFPRGKVPIESGAVELIIGFFDAERSDGARWSASDFKERSDSYAAQNGVPPGTIPGITDSDLDRIRAVLDDLLARWRALPVGETLELEFPTPAAE